MKMKYKLSKSTQLSQTNCNWFSGYGFIEIRFVRQTIHKIMWNVVDAQLIIWLRLLFRVCTQCITRLKIVDFKSIDFRSLKRIGLCDKYSANYSEHFMDADWYVALIHSLGRLALLQLILYYNVQWPGEIYD